MAKTESAAGNIQVDDREQRIEDLEEVVKLLVKRLAHVRALYLEDSERAILDKFLAK